MKIVYQFCIAILSIIALENVFANENSRFIYVSYNSPTSKNLTEEEFSIDVGRGIYYRGHAGIGMKLCNSMSAYYCFNSPAMSFAVPKSKLTVGQTWSNNRRDYVVLDDQRIQIIGRDIAVHVITADFDEKRKDKFYYSEELGLVAISIEHVGHGDPIIYTSKSLHGFPGRS